MSYQSQEAEILSEANKEASKTRKDILASNPEISKAEYPLYYCRVYKNDTVSRIRNRLSKYSYFSYLKQDVYDNKTIWFNISDKNLKPWMDLMIPIKIEDRQRWDSEFFKKSQIAISKMESNPIYWGKIKLLSNKIWKTNLARVMSTFARAETTNWNEKIGTWWLYRYESSTTYSISYYHIIMKWWWLASLNKLGLTQWDVCGDPIKAWMLFLWFRCEVESDVKKKWWKLEDCLNPNKKWWVSKAAAIYNPWSKSYSTRLENGYDHFKNMA